MLWTKTCWMGMKWRRRGRDGHEKRRRGRNKARPKMRVGEIRTELRKEIKWWNDEACIWKIRLKTDSDRRGRPKDRDENEMIMKRTRRVSDGNETKRMRMEGRWDETSKIKEMRGRLGWKEMTGKGRKRLRRQRERGKWEDAEGKTWETEEGGGRIDKWEKTWANGR